MAQQISKNKIVILLLAFISIIAILIFTLCFAIYIWDPDDVEKNTVRWYFGIPEYMKLFPVYESCQPAKYSYSGRDGMKISAGFIYFYTQDHEKAINSAEDFYLRNGCKVQSAKTQISAEHCNKVIWQKSYFIIYENKRLNGCTKVEVAFIGDD